MAQRVTIDKDGNIDIEIIEDGMRLGIYCAPDFSDGGWWCIGESWESSGDLSADSLKEMQAFFQNSTED